MLDGWYCRSLANEKARQQDDGNEPHVDVNDEDSGTDESGQEQETSQQTKPVDYRSQYLYLKRKLKFLIYENEYFQDALRSNQRRLLKVSRDRAFLLDRLLQYEKPENTSSESEETESSEDEAAKDPKKRKVEQTPNGNSSGGGAPRGRKKKVPPAEIVAPQEPEKPAEEQHQGHMTSAEVERHLQSKPPLVEMMPAQAPATVPTEMFSNEPSLDSESNEPIMDGASPSNVAAEECVPMEYSNQ